MRHHRYSNMIIRRRKGFPRFLARQRTARNRRNQIGRFSRGHDGALTSRPATVGVFFSSAAGSDLTIRTGLL